VNSYQGGPAGDNPVHASYCLFRKGLLSASAENQNRDVGAAVNSLSNVSMPWLSGSDNSSKVAANPFFA